MRAKRRFRTAIIGGAALALAFILTTCGRARDGRAGDGRAITGRIVEVGTFMVGPGKPGSREVYFTKHGDVFTARLGLKFGFQFMLQNVPDAPTIDLRTVVTHPPMKNKQGEIETHYELISPTPIRDGIAMGVTGYGFDRPEEVTPGIWTFEHSYQGRTLIRQSFTIRPPVVQPQTR